MSSPPPVTTPGSNVTPMWGTWGGRPPPQPPSCFSQLYGLNQCYDDIIMMQQILQKVICDMAANNPDFQKCLAEGIAAGGGNVPLIGVTNGTDAQPGQVGEFFQSEITVASNGSIAETVTASAGVLQPGDWDVWAWAYYAVPLGSLNFYLNPLPAGFSYNMQAFQITTLSDSVLLAPTARALISVPTLLAFSFLTNQTGAAVAGGNYSFFVNARRRR